MAYRSKITAEEHQFILDQAKEGVGYQELSDKLGNKISKQRVKQICKKARIDAFSIKQQKRNEEHELRMIKRWGNEWKNKEHRRSYVYQAMRSKFRTKKANAIRAGRQWTVDFGDLEFPTHCPILGIELDYFSETICDSSPSFDCVVPERDYVKGNVYVISQRANRIKNDGTADEHWAIAKFIELICSEQPPA